MTARRKPTAPAVAAETAVTPPPNFTTAHSFAGDFHINIAVSVNIPQLADLLPYLGGGVNTTILERIEAHMASFEQKLARLESTVAAFNEREAREDEEFVLSKAENTKLKKELADLQALHDAETATPEQEARFEALLKSIDDSNKIDSEVLPEVPDEEPTPTPTPEPAPEPTPTPTPTPDGTELPVEEVPPTP